jgi:uncharacterized RDD family membrane protein YckC
MNESLEKEITIITPEQVQLQFQTAGIGSRALAHLVDSLILGTANLILFFSIAAANRLFINSFSNGAGEYGIVLVIIFAIVLNAGYFILTEAYMGGQTPGKRFTGLRVLQNNGQSATMLSVIIRNLFRLLDMLPTLYFLGGAVMMFSKRDRRIGDMVAGTIVVIELQRERLKRRKRIDKFLAAKQVQLPALELDAFAKEQLTSKDWLLLSSWIERLPNLTKTRAEELSVPIASHLSGKLRHSDYMTLDSSEYLIALYLELRGDWDY